MDIGHCSLRYIRVFNELFRLRDEQEKTNEMSFSMMVSEIYNESMRDLLSTDKRKASDVKLLPDGTVQFVNLETHVVFLRS